MDGADNSAPSVHSIPHSPADQRFSCEDDD